MESFIVKADRGRVNVTAPLGMDYWVERNFAADTDTSIARLAPRTAVERARLGEDAELSRLHAQAVAWRKNRFDVLMQDEHYRSLFGRLMMTPPSRVLSPQNADRILRHALKARAARSS